MDSIWVSLAVAFVGLLSIVGAQLISSRSSARIAEEDRRAQRDEGATQRQAERDESARQRQAERDENARQRQAERDESATQRQAERKENHRQYRRDAYAALLLAARELQAVLSSTPRTEDSDAALKSLGAAAAHVELAAPALADGQLAAVRTAAGRLHGLIRAGRASVDVVEEAAAELESALRTLRDLMRRDIGTDGAA